MPASSLTPATIGATDRKYYPNWRVIVKNDDHNTFEHVVKCFVRVLPNMNIEKAWGLAELIHNDGAAVVWAGPLEQAEMYHEVLGGYGLTMAPIERDQ